MRKKKDGTIVASLTEVKNKTGDIFSLVDEYGEVVLTSYNKPKYKISKISVGSFLEIEGESEKKQNPLKSVVQKAKEAVSKPKEEEIEEPVANAPTLITQELVDNLAKLKIWERDSKVEIKYIKAILTPLQ